MSNSVGEQLIKILVRSGEHVASSSSSIQQDGHSQRFSALILFFKGRISANASTKGIFARFLSLFDPYCLTHIFGK